MSDFQSIANYHDRDSSSQHHRDRLNNHNCDMSTLAERLTEARQKRSLTQPELAKAAGVKNQSTIGMLESGARLSSSYIPAIADALGVPALWLAEGRGPNPFSEEQAAGPSSADLPVADAVTVDRRIAERRRSPLRGVDRSTPAKAALTALLEQLETHPPDPETEQRLAQELKLQMEWLKAVQKK